MVGHTVGKRPSALELLCSEESSWHQVQAAKAFAPTELTPLMYGAPTASDYPTDGLQQLAHLPQLLSDSRLFRTYHRQLGTSRITQEWREEQGLVLKPKGCEEGKERAS